MEIEKIIEICEKINNREEKISLDEIVLTICKEVKELKERVDRLALSIDEYYD